MAADLSHADWRKAARSAHNGGCVEIAVTGGTVAVRDSTSPANGPHLISKTAFAAFLNDARNGRYNP